MFDSRARWQTVYDGLRADIEQGRLTPGDTIPAETALQEQYSYSRATIRKAITTLEQDGLITAGSGRLGRQVRSRELISFNLTKFELGAYVDDPQHGVDQWEADAHSEGWTTRQVVTDVSELEAPRHVAEFLQIRPATSVVRRRRLRHVSRDGRPEIVAMVADTWTPLDIARKEIDGVAPLLVRENVVYQGGIYAALGHRQERFLDDIQARMPTPEEANLLRLPAGTPVGQHARVGIDHTGRRVRVLISTWAGDRQRLRYELNVPRKREDHQ